MKIGFFLREALRALKRNAVPSFAAMATVLVTVMLLGVFIPVVQATTGAANDVRGRVIADVFMTRDASDADIAARQEPDRERHAARQERRVRLQGRRRTRRRRRSIPAPMRRSATRTRCRRCSASRPTSRTTSPRSATRSRRSAPAGERTTIDSAIDEVSNREEDTNKILSVTRVVKLTTALLAGLLVIASILLIANTIRLSLYARRREVEVMKLVGATDWFIRWPFVIEGVLVGALGGLIAVLLLAVLKIALVDPLADQFAADRRAGHDELPAADRPAARRLGRGVGGRLGHLAAPLPARLARC